MVVTEDMKLVGVKRRSVEAGDWLCPPPGQQPVIWKNIETHQNKILEEPQNSN